MILKHQILGRCKIVAILLVCGILLLHPPRLNAVVDPATALAIAGFTLNLGAKLFPSGADLTSEAILHNRELIKNLNNGINELQHGLTAVMQKLDETPSLLRKDFKKLLDEWKEDEILAMVQLIVEDRQSNGTTTPLLEDRLRVLQKASRHLFLRHDRNAPTMIIAMRYELATMSALGATQQERRVRAKAYHDRFQKILDPQRGDLLVHLSHYLTQNESTLVSYENVSRSFSNTFDRLRQECERDKICGVETGFTPAERTRAKKESSGSSVYFLPIFYVLSQFGKEVDASLKRMPCRLRNLHSELNKMQYEYLILRYYHAILEGVEKADQILVDQVLAEDERAFRYETSSITQRLDKFAENLVSTKTSNERTINKMENYNQGRPLWRTENGFKEVHPSWMSEDGRTRLMRNETCNQPIIVEVEDFLFFD